MHDVTRVLVLFEFLFCCVLILCTFQLVLVLLVCCFFFFSSRRRHTRYWRDWSSDVCSSDLTKRRSSRCNASVSRIELMVVLSLTRSVRSRAISAMTGGRGHSSCGCWYSISSTLRRTVEAAVSWRSLNSTGFERGAVVSPSSSRKTRRDSPTAIWSPCSSACSRMGFPLTNVPFMLSRSKSRNESPVRRTAQCRRESSESAMRTEFEESRPIDNSAPPSSKAESFRGPATATSLGFISLSGYKKTRRERSLNRQRDK